MSDTPSLLVEQDPARIYEISAPLLQQYTSILLQVMNIRSIKGLHAGVYVRQGVYDR